MKISNQAKLYLSTLFVIVIAFAVTASSCAPAETSTPENNEPDPASNSFLFATSFSATHIIGESPCPQRVVNTQVYCSRDSDSCTADSAVITNPHPGSGVTAYFENNQQSIKLKSDPLLTVDLNVDFTCNVASSFNHKFKVLFYRNGMKVDEQELEIKMTVK